MCWMCLHGTLGTDQRLHSPVADFLFKHTGEKNIKLLTGKEHHRKAACKRRKRVSSTESNVSGTQPVLLESWFPHTSCHAAIVSCQRPDRCDYCTYNFIYSNYHQMIFGCPKSCSYVSHRHPESVSQITVDVIACQRDSSVVLATPYPLTPPRQRVRREHVQAKLPRLPGTWLLVTWRGQHSKRISCVSLRVLTSL